MLLDKNRNLTKIELCQPARAAKRTPRLPAGAIAMQRHSSVSDHPKPAGSASPAPPEIPNGSLWPRRGGKLLINDKELPHHVQVFMVKNVAVEHIRNGFGGVGVKSGGDDDLALGIHQHRVLPA